MILYHDLTQCSFLCRVNRFIAKCLVDGEETVVHVKNTGRLKELLVPGAACWLEKSGNPARKTAYDLVAVEKDGRVVNIDSQCPNLIAREWVQQGGWGDIDQVQSEVKWGDSRFDLAYRTGETQAAIEVAKVSKGLLHTFFYLPGMNLPCYLCGSFPHFPSLFKVTPGLL